MRHLYIHILGAAAIGVALALSPAPVSAKTAKECNTEYAAQKDTLKAAGTTKKAFVASCRAEPDSAAPGAAAAPAAPASAPSATAEAPAGGKTAKECNADYAANKAAIKAGGQTKKDFVASCRAGNEAIPTAPAAAAPAAAPAPAPAAAAPAPMAPAPTAAAPKPMAAPSASEMQLKAKCPSDTVVWVNTKSHIYHFAGTHDYGNTKQGAYMCEMDAKAADDRAAKNETHP
jgi:pyruvate/2-oxoglutarate dehydrogenase complex dihydrolipoamide acyltransferase (E2) component